MAEPTPSGAEDGARDNLTRQAVGGLRWTVTATAASLLIQLAYTAVMGRLLEPRVFGLVASAQVVLTFGSYFSEMGLGQALVQKAELVEEEVRAAFTSSVLLGLLATGAIVAAAPAIASLLDSPEVVDVVRVLSTALVLTALGLTSQNLLRRGLRFRAMAIIDVTATATAYLGVGLVLAFAGAGVWALVAAFLTQVGVKAVASVLVARHGIRPTLGLRRLRPLYAFGGRISLISALEYLGEAVVVVVIGRYAGQGPLGQFNRAFLLVQLPVVNLNFQLANVLFPTISRVQGDRERVRRAYVQAVRLVAAVLFPLGAGIAVAAPQVVAVVLGDQWDTAARLLPALALAAAMNAVSFFGGITAEALGELNAKLLLQGGYVVLLVAGLLAVPAEHLIGYVLVVAAAELVRLVAYAVFMGRVLSIGVGGHLRAFLPPVGAAAVVAAAIAGVAVGGEALGAPVALTLVAQVIAGAIALAAMATHGTLRGVRVELRDRVHGAYDGDTARGVTAVALRLLSLGDRRADAAL